MYSQKCNCYFQKRIVMFCLPVPPLIYLWEIYRFPGSVGLPILLQGNTAYVDHSWDYINRSQTHECENWDLGRTIPRKGIHKWDFPCSSIFAIPARFMSMFFRVPSVPSYAHLSRPTSILLRSRAILCYPVSSCLLKSESWLLASCPNSNYSMENVLRGDQCKCRQCSHLDERQVWKSLEITLLIKV